MNRVVYFGLAGMATVVAPLQAFAAGGAGISSLLWPAVNFALYSTLMVVLYKKYGAPALKARSIQIAGHLKEAAGKLSSASHELELANSRLQSIEGEKAELAKQYEQEAIRMSEAVAAHGNDTADRIASDTVRQIDNELSRAQKEVRAQVIALATEQARARLSTELSDADDRELRASALQGLQS